MRTWDKQGDGLISYEEFEDYYKVTPHPQATHFLLLLSCYATLRRAGARQTGIMNGCFLSSPSTAPLPAV